MEEGNPRQGKHFELVTDEGSSKQRLDVFVQSRLASELSRSRAQALIEDGFITLNGEKARPSSKVKTGDRVTVIIPPPVEWNVVPEEIPLEIVYEDRDVLVVNKPRGLVVHPAAGHANGTLVNAVLAICPDLPGIGSELRPGIVHRLDKDTTGLLVVAKNDQAMRHLQEQIKCRRAKRQYIALVKGFMPKLEGQINAPIGRHPVDRKKMAVVAPGEGREAVTEYTVVERFGQEYTLLVAKLLTGRTHQIRVHMAHTGHPVVGDPVYSRTANELGLEGQALHAFKLGFYKLDGTWLEFTVHIPTDFAAALEKLERQYRKELPTWVRDLFPPTQDAK